MLKTNSTNYEDILKKLRIKQIEGNETLLKFSVTAAADRERQNVIVRPHVSEHVSEYHTHDFFEINYVLEGNCINLVEDETILMNRGDMIIIHPGVFHTLYADSKCKVINLIIRKEWLCEKIKSVLSSQSAMCDFLQKSEDEDYYKYIIFLCSEADNSKATDAADKVIGFSRSDSAWKYLLVEAAMLEYLCVLGEVCENVNLSKGKGTSSYKMINILMYVAENYKTVTLDELSDRFFYSKTHICRLFLKNTGKSFNQTLTDMKINRACLFLKNTEMNVEDIAREVGYGSAEHFQRLFKRNIGMTPGDFRKNSKKNK